MTESKEHLIMRKVHFEGQFLELSEQDFLILLKGVVGGAYELAKTSHSLQISGFPDILDGLKSWNQRQLEQQEVLIPQIEDEELHELFHSLDSQVRMIEGSNDQLAIIIARFLSLPAPQTQRERQNLVRKMSKYSSIEGPMWINQPEYQQLAKQSKQTFSKIEEVKRRIDERLAHLLPALSGSLENSQPLTEAPSKQFVRGLSQNIQPQEEEKMEVNDIVFGDQRAKDLIDTAEAEPDPKRAIKLLHKALRFGRVGIQASKAYMGLAMRFEDLDDEERAIKYYTTCLEAWQPDAIV
ncbi:MAG: hypothetical protein L0Y56_04210, partial [Nitrospira sp.]|nr:hypothetical protein [Nitrospira sp.]